MKDQLSTGGSFPPRGRFEKRFSDVERPWLALPSKASTGFLLGLHVSLGFRPYTIYTGLLFLCVIRLENDRDTASISEVIHLDPATRSLPRDNLPRVFLTRSLRAWMLDRNLHNEDSKVYRKFSIEKLSFLTFSLKRNFRSGRLFMNIYFYTISGNTFLNFAKIPLNIELKID